MVLADLLNRKVEQPVIFNPEMCLDSGQLIEAWWKNIQNFYSLSLNIQVLWFTDAV